MTNRKTNRRGFTLVEMLVAAALIIFMMYVIATAFEKGLETFRMLKVQGDMQEKLRAAATAIRMDLSTPHFDGNTSLSTQGPYLGDQQLNNQLWQPPKKGYVRISMPFVPGTVNGTFMPGAVKDGVDPDNPSAPYYGLDVNTCKDLYMQFTMNLTDGHPTVRDGRGRRDQFYMTNYAGLNAYCQPDYNRNDPATPSLFTSYWVEVAYFVRPNGKFTDGGVALFDVYRRQKLLVEPAPPNSYPPQYSTNSGNIDTSYWKAANNFMPFNGATDVTEPFRRWGMNPTLKQVGQQLLPAAPWGLPASPIPPFTTILDEVSLADPRTGGDLLMTNVLNFEIKATWDPIQLGAPNTDRFNTNVASNFTSPSASATVNGTSVYNPDYPFDYLPVGINPGLATGSTPPRVFDTWSCNTDTTAGTPITYGPPVTGPMNQQEYGAWNQGHFGPLLPGGQQAQPTAFTMPLRIRVRAVQIKLRVWDQKTSQTRQETIIQDL
jgi:type II secretory pathway pseudopilin PulG